MLPTFLRRALGALVALLVAAAVGRADTLRTLALDLRAAVRGFQVDADVWAGGRWTMRVTPGAAPGQPLTHSLVAPSLEPWRFYWVDPAGPWGELAWGGTTRVLPSHAPGAREAVDAAALQWIQGIYQDWRSQGGDFPLDGNDSFYVFGDPAGRFAFSTRPDGRQTGPVHQAMTAIWIPDGVARWEAGEVLEGWGFGQEMASPPASYEPHLYDALAEAVRLLSGSVMHQDDPEATAALGPGATFARPLGTTPKRAFQVLKTLVPQVGKSVSPRDDLSFPHRVEAVDEATLTVVADTGPGLSMGDSVKGRVVRRVRYDRQAHHVVADVVEVQVRRSGNAQKLTLRIGYGPVGGR